MNWEKLLIELAKFLISKFTPNDTLVSIITLEDSHQSLSHVTFCDRLDCTHQAPLSMGLSWEEY